MVFACQLNSFQKTFTAKVKSCQKVENGTEDCFEVICEDTILFPEGGGQPFDTGFLDDIPVYQVLRRGADAVHFVKQPVVEGQEVQQTVDWDRRFDHMQQHSGQHLITAVINEEYKISTTSWWLGVDVCHIELDTKSLSAEQMERIEKVANEKIINQVPVRVKMCNIGDPALDVAHTRGLPEDVSGPIRIVEIVGMEDNLCCGTHVENLLQLQSIKLLYTEKGKKNKTNLFFLAGGRVLKYLDQSLKREQKLTKLLNNEPDQHSALVEKLQINVKTLNKKLSTVLKRVAVEQAQAFQALAPRPRYYLHHCKEAEGDYVDVFLKTVKEDSNLKETLLVLLVGENAGTLTLFGSEDLLEKLATKLADVLGGKGKAQSSRFQAKVTKLTPKNVEMMLKILDAELGK